MNVTVYINGRILGSIERQNRNGKVINGRMDQLPMKQALAELAAAPPPCISVIGP